MKADLLDRKILPGGCLIFETQTNAFKSQWHSHHEYELVYIKEGNGTLHYGESSISYEANNLFLFGPWIPHEFIENSKNHHSISCIFHEELLSLSSFECNISQNINSLLRSSLNGIVFMLSKKDIEDTTRFFTSISKDNGLRQAINLLMFIFRITKLQSKQYPILNIHNPHEQNFIKKYSQLQNILKYIHSNISENITIRDITHRFYISRSSLSRLFHEIIQMNFTQYVTQKRISYACELLTTTQLPITEISNTTGFRSISSFNRSFLKYKYISPRAYRKKFIFS